MKFIATSNSYHVANAWSQEFGINPKNQKLTFIDTAAEVYNKAEADWLIEDRQALVELGFEVSDYTLTNKTQEQLKTDLAEFDILFVSGGNSFYLLEKEKLSGFDQLITTDFWSDKIYVGSSAGSVILSNDIDIIKHLDDATKANLPDTKAIGILDLVILPHWGNDHFKPKYLKLVADSYAQNLQSILLTDDQYLLIKDQKIQFKSI